MRRKRPRLSGPVTGAVALLQRAALTFGLSACVLAGCAGLAATADRAAYHGEIEAFLEPVDAQGACAVTVGLRNRSGVRQGEARLRLAWMNAQGKLIEEQRLRMDPVDVAQYDAKNLVLPIRCANVERLRVRSAEWSLGWDATVASVVPIAGVDGVDLVLRWDEKLQLYVAAADAG